MVSQLERTCPLALWSWNGTGTRAAGCCCTQACHRQDSDVARQPLRAGAVGVRSGADSMAHQTNARRGGGHRRAVREADADAGARGAGGGRERCVFDGSAPVFVGGNATRHDFFGDFTLLPNTGCPGGLFQTENPGLPLKVVTLSPSSLKGTEKTH